MRTTLLVFFNQKIRFPSILLFPSLNPIHRFLFHNRVEKSTSYLGEGNNETLLDSSLNRVSGIGRSVLLRCSYLLGEEKGEIFTEASLQDLLFKLSDISPETTRRYRRVSQLKAEDVLDILLGFDFDSGKPKIERRKVGVLWKLFNWVTTNQSKGFEHLPQSYEVMASMLIRGGLLGEAEILLSKVETQGISLAGHEKNFSKMVDGYIKAQELDKSMSIYDRTRRMSLIPSESCYHGLLNLLVRMNKPRLAFQVYMDMVDVGLRLSNAERTTFDRVIRLLCNGGKIQKARNLVKRAIESGMEPSQVVLNEITNGYCEKNDFKDPLNFLVERKRAPNSSVCNKIVSTLCRKFGTEKAYLFMQELESIGFRPDQITFGILISYSCRQGRLKDAFIYLSEILSRCLQPNVCSYNALIGGVFKKDMWKHARDVLDEMTDKGITPDLSTFRFLLAGYCKVRQFDEAKLVVREMVNHGLLHQLSPSEDLLSKAFFLVGLNPLDVKVKRDNDVGLSKTEFYDSLGNGLYLETDVDKYEKTLTQVLEDSMIPDFNLLVLKECDNGNFKTALMVIGEMVQWGQKLSLSAFSVVVKGLCASRSHVKAAIHLLEETPDLANQLDQETLNLLVRAISKKGFTYKGRMVFNGMLQRCLPVESETFTALIMGLCKEGNVIELHRYWDFANKYKWLPSLKDCKALVACLCKCRMLREAFELLERMLEINPHLSSDLCDVFLEVLADMGLTSIGHIFVEEVLRRGWVLNHAAYSHLISGFCKEKKNFEAFRILDTMLDKKVIPSVDVSCMLIPQLCRFLGLEKAIALKDMMLREQPTDSLSLYNALANGLCREGKIDEVVAQFREMLANGVLPDSKTYNLMIQGHCQVSMWRNVRELLGIMVRKKIRISISGYRNLVHLTCKEGKVFYALNMKEHMLREADYPYLTIYNILIFSLFQTGNSFLVATLLEDMHEKSLVFDEVTYNFLVNGYYRCKDVSRSVEALNTMIYKDLKPSARSLRIVISHMCGVGELDKALELSREMESRGWIHGSIVQNAIVEGLLSHGRCREADIFLDRLVVKGLVPDGIRYDGLIKRFCWHGRPNRAVDLLNIMLRKGNIPNPTSYDHVIQSLCSCKALDQAINLHCEMLDRKLEPSINTWDVLVHSLCEDGQTVEAEMLLDSMLQMGQRPTRNMFCSLIDSYRFGNNLKRASEILQKMQQNGYAPDFKTHWSLISILSNSIDKDSGSSVGFLSRLLSQSGFTRKKDVNDKVG